MTDPYAAATATASAQPQSNGNMQGTSTPVSAAGTRALDPKANPFATPDTVGGGGGPRGPRWPEILGRLIVLEPTRLLADQPVPNQPGQKQSFYVCNLTVLGTGKVEVYTPAREVEGKTFPEETQIFDTPYTWQDWYTYGKAMTVKLEACLKAGFPLLLGVVKRCPTGAGYRKGETWQDTERIYAAYMAAVAAGREPTKPQFSWAVIDPTPEQQQQALTWYRERSAAK